MLLAVSAKRSMRHSTWPGPQASVPQWTRASRRSLRLTSKLATSILLRVAAMAAPFGVFGLLRVLHDQLREGRQQRRRQVVAHAGNHRQARAGNVAGEVVA